MAKKFSKALPIGTLVYPKLDRVDVYQPLDKKGKPNGEEKRRWLVNVKFGDAEHREVQAWLDDVAKQAGLGDRIKMPWRKDKKTGELWLVAASGEQYKPSLYGANNQKLPAGVTPGGGSKARIFVNANPYEGFGGGINLYLSSVQVIELVESSFGKSPFEATEGYAPEASTEEPKEFDPHAAAGANEDMDDEIPF
jgi:hypothetical protein